MFVLLLAGCAAPAAPAAPAAEGEAAPAEGEAAAPAGEEKIELRIAWWGSQDRHDRTIKVIEMFEALHPNIDIVYEFGGFNDHLTKMSTQAAGGNLPDIMQQDYAWIGEWSARELLMPLDDFIADGTLDFSNVSDSELAGGRIDGKLYAVNLGTNSQAITLDLDAFEKAGIELPRPDWTWEEFEQIVLGLHDKLGIWGFGPLLGDEQIWACPSIWATGNGATTTKARPSAMRMTSSTPITCT